MGGETPAGTEGGVTYVEFRVTDAEYPFVGASLDGGSVFLEEMIPRGERGYGEFYSVHGVSHETVIAGTEAHGSVDVELLVDHEEGRLYEFVVHGEDCPAVYLGESGALPREVESVDGEGLIGAEIPASLDSASVIREFLDAHPDAELITKQRHSRKTPLFSHRELQQGIEERLTDRQQDALTVAHEHGYYDWPRETSGEELAEKLNIAPPTFYQHLRAAEQELISLAFQTNNITTS